MSARKDTSPSVATFADHEVITPANPLYKAIAQAPAKDDDPVARAEAALALLSTEFAEWMQSECERLETARQEVVRQGFTEKTHAELSRAVSGIVSGTQCVGAERKGPDNAGRNNIRTIHNIRACPLREVLVDALLGPRLRNNAIPCVN
jgi:hypothetical protein